MIEIGLHSQPTDTNVPATRTAQAFVASARKRIVPIVCLVATVATTMAYSLLWGPLIDAYGLDHPRRHLGNVPHRSVRRMGRYRRRLFERRRAGQPAGNQRCSGPGSIARQPPGAGLLEERLGTFRVIPGAGVVLAAVGVYSFLRWRR